MTGMPPGAGARSANAVPEEVSTEKNRSYKIQRSGETEERRKKTHPHEQERIENDLPPRTPSLWVHNREHANPRARIVLAIHPRNGEEVRKLPEEEDRKQHPSAR
jgi:hypothetical protein